jgi:hypothetical protein
MACHPRWGLATTTQHGTIIIMLLSFFFSSFNIIINFLLLLLHARRLMRYFVASRHYGVPSHAHALSRLRRGTI